MDRCRPLAGNTLAVLFALAAPAAMAGDPPGSWAASLHFENDLFADTDSQYTNGIKLTVVSPDLSSAFDSRAELPPLLQQPLNWILPYIPFIEERGAARTLAFSIGQNMYTPDDILDPSLIPDDRPYAGWLYFATTFQTRTSHRQDTFDAQIGVVGAPSLARQAQDLVHRLRGIDRARGWSNQLRTEPGLVLSYERVLRSPVLIGADRGFGVDALARGGGAVGNIAVYAAAGGQLRVGWNLPPDFGYSVIRPGGVTQVNALPDTSEQGSAEARRRGWLRRHGLTLYGFVGADGRLVIHDLFLDGNTFRDSHSVDHLPFVADLLAGFTLGYGGFKLSMARVLRTREFRGQRDDHRFGSITLSYDF